PGWAKTDLFSNGPGAGSFSDKLHRYVAEPLFAQTAAAGALPTLYAATAPEAAGGRLYAPRGLLELSGPPALGQITPAAADAGTAALLWKASETLSRVRFAPFAAAA
ncbi:MAG TPA: hypothetical protein VJM31_12615, partial [Vicinamibacterales bacterium]|nr:hypothetical protein [Vicinamibacterales bacterium]